MKASSPPPCNIISNQSSKLNQGYHSGRLGLEGRKLEMVSVQKRIQFLILALFLSESRGKWARQNRAQEASVKRK